MVKYTPISTGVPLKASESTLVQLCWSWGLGPRTIDSRRLAADFIAENGQICRVECSPEIIRVLDEMPLSTEEDDVVEGLVPDNFAYIVEGAKFWNMQSETLKHVMPHLRHYRLITGWDCIDIISAFPLRFTAIERDQDHPKTLSLDDPLDCS